MDKMPKWADVVLIPLISVLLALIVSGLVVALIGESPVRAMEIMVRGAFGSAYGWGYTLYYATNFIFTGLAVAVAFHARLFNIGGEGQAAVGGLGVAVILLGIAWPHWTVALLAAMVFSALFGAAWAAIPAYLQARRGSHIVITTIMFNYIAAALLVYLLVNVFRVEGSMAPESATFAEAVHLPSASDFAAFLGFRGSTPLNFAFFVALVACVFVWLLIWRTRLGYEIRAFGHSQSAAVYAGINPVKITMITMLISGGLAGMMAVNVVMGEAERLVLDFVEGAGFVGIAVALMGRSHPVGVVLAALLFGALYQGGAELQFEMPAISREMIVVIQALVILFTGALDNMVRMPMERLFLSLRRRSDPAMAAAPAAPNPRPAPAQHRAGGPGKPE
ncbi:ABC transporter permease [Roseibacterium sp. SDUM158017]|uniref:ABC transporter permease n=1 Tax=Roseicyclus salinarum TaxID=3036773 RepID=UPI0024156A1F|nr:ABC transporter permease [Roseibacterium sp. SDUM158017]MDG4647206.1 ABC transporter permease [Roseibacterium sp. SDUM158017]